MSNQPESKRPEVFVPPSELSGVRPEKFLRNVMWALTKEPTRYVVHTDRSSEACLNANPHTISVDAGQFSPAGDFVLALFDVPTVQPGNLVTVFRVNEKMMTQKVSNVLNDSIIYTIRLAGGFVFGNDEGNDLALIMQEHNNQGGGATPVLWWLPEHNIGDLSEVKTIHQLDRLAAQKAQKTIHQKDPGTMLPGKVVMHENAWPIVDRLLNSLPPDLRKLALEARAPVRK